MIGQWSLYINLKSAIEVKLFWKIDNNTHLRFADVLFCSAGCGWCWFAMREKYCWLVGDLWLVLIWCERKNSCQQKSKQCSTTHPFGQTNIFGTKQFKKSSRSEGTYCAIGKIPSRPNRIGGRAMATPALFCRPNFFRTIFFVLKT